MATARRFRWKRRFYLRVLVPAGVTLIATALLCGAALLAAGRGTDSMSLMAQQIEVWRAISRGMDDLSMGQEAVGLCEECIERTESPERNRDWLDKNIGSTLFEIYDVHETYILDGGDAPVYAYVGGQRAPAARFEHVRASVSRFVNLARGRAARPSKRSSLNERLPGLPPAPVTIPAPPSLADEPAVIYPTVQTAERVAHATDMVRIGKRIAFVSAMPMVKTRDTSQALVAEAPILVSLRYLDERFLLDVAARNFLLDARLSDDPYGRDGEASAVIRDADGTPLGNLHWRPLLGGSAVIDDLLLPAAGGFALMALLVLAMALRMRGLLQQDDEHLAALQKSEESLRLAQQAARLGTFETDGATITGSELFYRQLGIEPVASLTGEECMELIHPADRHHAASTVSSGFANDDVFQCECRIIRPDTGEVRWMTTHNIVERDEEGRLIRTVGAQRDITEQKLAEESLRRNEERLRLVQEATGLADFETDAAGRSVCSPRFFAQAGLPVGDGTIDFDRWIRCVHPADRDRLRWEVEKALATADEFSCEFRVVHAQTGESRWILSRTKVIRDQAGKLVRTIGAHLDITEQRRAQEAIKESEERFRLAAEAAGLGIWDYDPTSGKKQWSERLTSILGLPQDAEADLELAIACVHPEDRTAFREELAGLIGAGRGGRFECSFRICRINDGVQRWVTMNGWKSVDANGRANRLIVTVRDSTDEKSAAEQARWSADHDPLTGLANRRLFQRRLVEALARPPQIGVSPGILLLDLDHFKQINDTLGHDAGDRFLKTFAERLKSVMGAGDTVARCGGDEFALLVTQANGEEHLSEIAQSIIERLQEPFVDQGRVLDCRASIGVSIFPAHGKTPEELLKNADIALYAAKNAGRGTSVIFEPRLRSEMQRRKGMIQLGRDAVRGNRIVPFYQPKVDLTDGSVAGYEALLRWRAPSGHIHYPGTIEAAFQDVEVAAQISDRMISAAIADMRQWLESGVHFAHVAVNAAAAEFRRDNFAERLLEQLAAAQVPPEYFQLEVTETVFLGRGAEFVHRALRLLSNAGVKIALDDFGTGYASLRHLKQFPVDVIKIDQSFVRDMDVDPSDEAIVRAVINLGINLGIKVVAEGIETAAQAQQLVALGCHFGQGYLFSRAVPASQVPALGPVLPVAATRDGADSVQTARPLRRAFG